MRKLFLWLHRWTGLVMAGFLLVVAVTGCVLAYWDVLNRLVTPALYPPPRPGAVLDMATLIERAEALAPEAEATGVSLATPGVAQVAMEPASPERPTDFEYLHLDPVDGRALGRSGGWRDWPHGRNDILPFIYQLHMNLAGGETGEWLLGVVALVWTLDCFVGLYLTFPRQEPGARLGFFRRWGAAWRVRPGASAYRVNFDLHRASGLWLWLTLLIFAWSSVMLNLPGVYARATSAVVAYEPPAMLRAATTPDENWGPMAWAAAEQRGRALMAEQAARDGFSVDRAVALNLHAARGLYEYRAHSSRDIGVRGYTSVFFDASSGALRAVGVPSGGPAGTTVSNWLLALHTVDVFGAPYRLLVFLTGAGVATLSVTGVYIWWRKRTARASKSAAPPTV